MHNNQIVSIQIIRAVAAMLVAFAHFHHEFIENPGGFNLGSFGFGVDLFFVISGFIMLHISWDDFGKPHAGINFALRRLARIVPIYWLVTIAVVAVTVPYCVMTGRSLDDFGVSATTLVGSLLFFPVARPNGDIMPILGIGWTLNFEMMFYAIFALALFVRRNLAIGLVAAALVMLSILGIRGTFSGWTAPLFLANPIILEFVLGMALAVAYRSSLSLPVPLAVCLICGGVAVAWFGTGWHFDTSTRPLIFGGAAVLIVAAATLGKWGEARRWLGPLVMLGNASYALYLVHPLIQIWPKAAIKQLQLGIDTQTWPFLSAMIALSIIASLTIHACIEKPLTRWLIAKSAILPPAAFPR